MDARFEQLNKLVAVNSPFAHEEELLRRAFTFAQTAHAKQKRKSGEPYFNHVYEAAKIAASWKLDTTTVAATLLHDTVEDTDVTLEQLAKEFGKEIAFIVNGVTKISHIKYRGNAAQAETLKKMIIALSEDIRVVFVKLADRTHNMRTLQHLPPEKQHRIALETSEIYAPLAFRLGLGSVAGDLEDMAFPYLNPEAYRELTERMKEYLDKGDVYVKRVRKELIKALEGQRITVNRIDSRVKRISSLHKKLRRYKMNLSEIHDLIALRVIVNKVEDCYAVLGVIHSLWTPLPGKIKDYIALPKPNGYRSLHTTVICLDRLPTEIQIRTEEMHYENEFGVAAYWAYSEGKKGKAYENNQAVWADSKEAAWVNKLKQWQQEIEDPDEYINAVKVDLFKDRIFVITPKGEAIDLPLGATPVDFAYAIHSEIGDHCQGAKVNDRMVPLDHELQSGDVVEIHTNKNKKPSAAWLEFLKTRHARSRVRAQLRLNDPSRPRTTQFVITGQERIALIRDIGALFTKQKMSIQSIETLKPKHGLVTLRVTVEIDTPHKADAIALKLRSISMVSQVDY